MFAPIGRRLALVNAIVIAVIVVVVGVLALSVLRVRIDQQAQDTLAQRAMVAATGWAPALAANQLSPVAASVSPSGNDAEASSGNELIESGDTFLLAFTRDGALVANPRGLNPDGLSRSADVALAIAGKSRVTHVQLSDGETAQVYTTPVRSNGAIVGAVQAIQGSGEHDQTVQLLGIVVAASAGLGILLAAPAGLFLARRAMRPIDIAFEHQQTFVADAAHELRTPLTVLRANAELIERIPDMDRRELMEEVGSMVQEIDEMTRLVNDLLDLAKADAGRLIVKTQSVELGGLIGEAVRPMTALAASAGLSLTVHIAAPVFIAADPGRIRQLMRVLVDNAISYTSAGGKVDILIARSGSQALIEVRDTGVGIPPDELQNVFRRFYRADHSRARSEGGAGLGLSIAHAIATAHGGEIQVESVPGHGAVFRVLLPGAHSGELAPANISGVSMES